MAYISRIANSLLVTPFDDKSAVSQEIFKKLTEDVFCEHCYSHPKFERELELYLEEDANDEYGDFPTYYDTFINQIYQQQSEYQNFEEWLNNFDYYKVYTITGNAGTGKTTFINYRKYNEKKIRWIVLDIYRARKYTEWMSDIRTDIKFFEQAQSKVYGSIMNKIWELLFQGLDTNKKYSLQIVYDNLNKLTTNYKKNYYDSYPSGRILLNKIYEVMERDEPIESKVEKSAEIYKKVIDGNAGEDGGGIVNLLDILLLTLRCLYDPDDKFVIIFDNFERFISNDEIFNKDIEKIRLLLTHYIAHINQEGRCHKGYFKFIMAIRDSTARMCDVKLHVADVAANNLDLGKWYDIDDIIYRKKQWYSDNQISLENLELIEQITGDRRICIDKTITGINLLIGPLFNDNKRLIIDFIGTMVEHPRNKKNIGAYMNFWEENTSLSRFAARSIMRGMILNELEEKPDKLFEHLKTYSTRGDNGIGDARKILTVLYNNISKGKENELQLSMVLKELLNVNDVEKFWVSASEQCKKKRTTISEILFYMNSYNRRENDWIQFIDLQFKDRDNNIVVEDPDKLEQIISKNMKKCSIHLMPAGVAYLKYIVASFEFFSLRYSKEYAPLFTLIPSPQNMENCISVKDLPCFIIIEKVVTSAINCIEILKTKEDTIKILIGNNMNGIYHHMRIINQHQAYIANFRTFIKNKYCSAEKMDYSIRQKYKSLCKEINSQEIRYDTYKTEVNKNTGR